MKMSPKITFFTIVCVLMTAMSGCVKTTQVSTQNSNGTEPNRWRQDPEEIARARTAIAADFIRKNQLDDAQRQLDQALKSYPKYAPAYDMMGVLLQQEGSPNNLQKAESYFKQAIKLDPNFTQAVNNYGVYLSQMKRYNEAIAQFQLAGSTLGYDGRASALENLGRTALKVNDKALATQAFLKALEANRFSIIARSELIDMLLSEGRNQQAKSLHDDLVSLIGEDKLDPRTLLQGVRLARALGNTTLQQKYTQQLFDRQPLSPEARQLRTWLSNPAATWN